MMLVLMIMLEQRHLFFYLDFTQRVDIVEQNGLKIPGADFKLAIVVVVSDFAGIFVDLERKGVSRKALRFGHS